MRLLVVWEMYELDPSPVAQLPGAELSNAAES